MRNEKLFLEFISFCESQPEDKEINHQGWGTCAVGEFAASRGLVVGDVYCDGSYDEDFEPFRDFIETLQGEPINDREYLTSDLSKWLCKINLPKTYGEFTKELKTFI